MLREELVNKIKFELSEIELELDSYRLLFDKSKIQKPDLIEITAIASVLHSFYNGIENIFLIVSKNIDKNVPNEFNWHIQLLKKMKSSTKDRSNVISEELSEILNEYLAFRHFFRHSYKFKLDWEKIKELSIPLYEVWSKVKNEVKSFLEGI